ncbi:MAG TPA: hypothetical protein VES69_07565 [Pyrinomonadaceae bacterium]|nr:hypothetical protein [Pyrinomonadaceae bacterium]
MTNSTALLASSEINARKSVIAQAPALDPRVRAAAQTLAAASTARIVARPTAAGFHHQG